MAKKGSLSDDQIHQLRWLQINKVVASSADRLVFEFVDGKSLAVTWQAQGLHVEIADPSAVDVAQARSRPTKRQLDYLLFIRKYMERYGRAPAESDIERHFMVSAPSVNQMMQMLERRGFISRQPGVPRSARLCIDLDALI